jgi:DNA-binding NarL/FixJ family response regulator/signal transduction histidine kinase
MSGPPIRLLLIEDNPGDRRLLEFALAANTELAFDLRVATSLEEALAALRVEAPDVLLLDLYLPDSAGLDTLHAVSDAAADVPIIVLTQEEGESIALESLRAGAEDFLRKAEIGAGALGRAVSYALERRRRAGHDHFLSHALSAIGATLDAENALRMLANLTVPALADWCLVELIRQNGEVVPVEIVAADVARQRLLRSKLSSYPHAPGPTGHPAARVLSTGESVLLPLVTDDDLQSFATDAVHLRLLRELGARSMMVVPLRGEDGMLGAVTLALSVSDRRFGDAELAVMEEIAAHAAAIIDNDRRFREARQAATRAEETADRARRQERLSSALAAAVTPPQVAAVVVRESMHMVGARAGALLVARAGEEGLTLLRAAGLPDSLLPLWSRWPSSGDSPVAAAIARGCLRRVGSVADLRRRDPESAKAFGAELEGEIVVVPLILEERPLGALLLLLPDLGPGTEEAEDILAQCAGKCAAALQRAFLFEREQRALEDAKHATRLRDEVLGVVAHDLRNPVSAIATYASLLQEPEVSDEKRLEWARTVHDLTAQMNKLIRDLIDVGKVESGTLELELDSALLPDVLIGDALALMEPLAAADGVQIRCEVAASLPAVVADRDRILQVFSNLLQNAVRFTPAGGTVSIRGEALAGEVLFLVVDSGPGISLEDRPRLFDRFWQARHSRRGGAGLGLAIAKGIVERHGGRIGVESRPGSGSTFFFTLPVAAADVSQPRPGDGRGARAPSAVEPAPDRARPAIRVMIVDDHPLVRRGLREKLVRAGGFEVVAEATTGEEAVRMVPLSRPEIVLMDLNLPGIGGIEATRRITSGAPHVRVLALSAEPEDDVLLEVLEAGGSGFVRKASAAEDLIPALETVDRGEVFLYPSGNKLLLGEFRFVRTASETGLASVLTEQERQVLSLAAEGYNSTEIGKKLFLSPKTVDSYRSRAMRRVGLSSRPDLVRFAIRAGLLVDRSASTR